MAEVTRIPTENSDLTDQQRATLTMRREVLAKAQELGDLYTEWYAATELASHLWNLVGQYGADCCAYRGDAIDMSALYGR